MTVQVEPLNFIEKHSIHRGAYGLRVDGVRDGHVDPQQQAGNTTAWTGRDQIK